MRGRRLGYKTETYSKRESKFQVEKDRGRRGGGEIPRWEENKQLIKGAGVGDATKKQQQLFFFFLHYPPEKSGDNMLQRKNILLTAP